ncbi:MAG: class I SAM-dependent methyltransferase [Vicinamibacteria bacterium]
MTSLLPDTPVVAWIKEHVLTIPGWTPEDQLQALFAFTLASGHLEGDVLELGSWCGRSSVVLGAAASRAGSSRVRCVDPFPERDDWIQNADGSYSMRVRIGDRVIEGYDEQTVWQAPFDRDIAPLYRDHGSVRAIFDASLKNFGVADRVHTFRGTASMFAESSESAGFRCRLAFVDGDHGYESVLKDIELILGWLVPGGWICFDDAFSGYAGVTRAIEEAVLTNDSFDLTQQVTRKMFVARRRLDSLIFERDRGESRISRQR